MLSAILLLLCLAGCDYTDDDFVSKYCPGACTVLQGRVTTANGTVPLPGAMLKVVWVKSAYLHPTYYRSKGLAYTDANGNYELHFLVRDGELAGGYFKVEVGLNPRQYLSCYSESHMFVLDYVGRDTTLVANYEAPRKAFVEVQLVNPEAIGQDDIFRIDFLYRVGTMQSGGCGRVITWSKELPANPVLPVAADQPIEVTSRKTKDGVTTTTQETLFISAGQKVVYQAVF